MSDTHLTHGRCLCGKVGITVANIHHDMHACHCSMCRKWTGGPTFSLECGTDVAFDGEEHIGIYASSEWAERGFCKHCGTSLFYRATESKEYFMSPELFDDIAPVTFQSQIFIDKKPDYYTFADKTQMMTEAEVLAMYDSPDES